MATPTLWTNSLIRSMRPNFTSVPSATQFSTTTSRLAKSSRKGSDKDRAKTAKLKSKLQRKKHPTYRQYDVREMEQFALCDAMRYIRAFEVGRTLSHPKYECHVKLKTKRDGAIVRNQLRLPHSVKTDVKICVICPPNNPAAQHAAEAGAILVGEENVFEVIKSGKIGFDRCLAHPDSVAKMGKEGIPRILGPKGLMPSIKLGTVVQNPGAAVKSMLGGSMYRERQGVVRMPVGQLGFSPEQLRDNIQAFMRKMKNDIVDVSDMTSKEISEVVGCIFCSSLVDAYTWQVLSSTNSPGFSLNGNFKSENSPPTSQLAGS